MTCPKCHKENLHGKFCDECGAELNQRLIEAENAMQTYSEQKSRTLKDFMPILSPLLLAGIFIACLISVAYALDKHGFLGIVLAVADIILSAILMEKAMNGGRRAIARRIKKAEQEFLHLHPDYAEILKKAKSAEDKASADEGRGK